MHLNHTEPNLIFTLYLTIESITGDEFTYKPFLKQFVLGPRGDTGAASGKIYGVANFACPYVDGHVPHIFVHVPLKTHLSSSSFSF